MAKTYEIAFKLAGQLSGNFSQTFQTASKTVEGMNKSLNALNKQAADMGKIVKMRQEVGHASREYVQAKQKVADLGRAFSSHKQIVNSLQQEYKQAKSETERLAAEIKKAKNPSEELTRAFEQSKLKTDILGRSLKDAETELKQLNTAFNKEKNALDKAKTSLDRKKSSLKEMESAAGTAGTSLKELIQREKDLADAADKARIAQEKLAKINGKFEGANNAQSKLSGVKADSAGAVAGIGAAVAGTLGVPVKQAMAMEDAMAEVRKVVDFDTPDGLANLQKQLEEMSLRIPMSADGLAQIAAAAGQSGIAAKDLASFTEQAAKMGVAFDISAEDAGTMMSKWKSGMGLTMEQTYALADSTNALSNSNAATAAQIGEVLQRYGALGKVAGLTEQQIAAFAASTIAAGAAPEVAATGIKAFMRAMGKGGSMSKKQGEAFEKIGLNPKQLQKDLQKDGPAAIIKTLETIQKKLPKEKWNEYLSIMFGEEASVAVGPMMANLEGLKKNFELVGDSSKTSGSMLKEFEARSATTSNALTLAKNAAMYAARAIGAPLLEPIKELAKSFVATAQSVGQWIEKNKPLVMQILKIAGVVVGAVTAFHLLRLAFAFTASPIVSLYKGFLLLQKGFTLISSGALKAKAMMIAQSIAAKATAAAQWLLNTSFLGCPIVWIIAGLAALVAAGILLWKNWDTVKAKCVQLWAMFSEKFPNLAAIAKGAFNLVVAAGKLLWAGLSAVFSAIVAGLQWLWSFWKAAFLAIVSAAQVWFSGISGVFSNVLGILDNVIGFVKNVFTGNWKAAWENVKNIFANAFSALVGLVKAPLNAVISLVNSAIGAMNGISVSIPDWVPGMGGKKFGVNIPKIPQLAEGGITLGPTLAMIGEGREQEAVLPLSKLDSLLGRSGGGGGNMSVSFAPVINVSGGGQDAYAQVKRGLDEGQRSLKRELERLMQNQRRLAYS